MNVHEAKYPLKNTVPVKGKVQLVPYTMKSPPAAVKNLPVGAIKLFVAAFNAVFAKTKNENQARIAGWSAVKTKYAKGPKGWYISKPMKADVAVRFLIRHMGAKKNKEGGI